MVIVFDFVKNAYRKVFVKKQKTVPVLRSDSVTLGPDEYRYVNRPMTATERTIDRIQKHNARMNGTLVD